jgi:ABC-type sugar transport system substrate-binding protein
VSQFNDAIAAKPNVIIVDHGLADSVNPKIDEAIGQGIPVVVYDVNIANCKATYISQDDQSIATKILDYKKQDNPNGGKVAYVNVSGIAPLDSRDAVYQEFLKANPSFTQTTRFGKYSESVAADTATEGAAALKAAPDTTLAFAAYDELAKGTLIALRQNNLSDKVKVYGVDVSTAPGEVPGLLPAMVARPDPVRRVRLRRLRGGASDHRPGQGERPGVAGRRGLRRAAGRMLRLSRLLLVERGSLTFEQLHDAARGAAAS